MTDSQLSLWLGFANPIILAILAAWVSGKFKVAAEVQKVTDSNHLANRDKIDAVEAKGVETAGAVLRVADTVTAVAQAATVAAQVTAEIAAATGALGPLSGKEVAPLDPSQVPKTNPGGIQW